MPLTRTEESTPKQRLSDSPKPPDDPASADQPKKYGLFAYIISNIINSISIMFIIGSVFNLVNLYFTMIKSKSSSKDGLGDKFPFEVQTPDFFANKSYFVDKTLNSTIETGLKCSEEISKISKTADSNKDLFRRIEELNRQRFILISGEPGTGKTFTTKTILGKLPDKYRIINVVPSALQSKYIGESAKNLSNIFRYIQANHTKENLEFVVFFDECDTLLETSKANMGRETLINQFLVIAGGDDKIKRLPFVCIFTTNTNVHQMMERGHRRFTHVTPDLMNKESLEVVFKNYSADHPALRGVKDLDKFCKVFQNQVLQYPLDFLKKVVESEGCTDAFNRELIAEETKKKKICEKALNELVERTFKFCGAFKTTQDWVNWLDTPDNLTRKVLKDCSVWLERNKQELQSICVEFRRVNRLSDGTSVNLPNLKQALEKIIGEFRATAEKLKEKQKEFKKSQ